MFIVLSELVKTFKETVHVKNIPRFAHPKSATNENQAFDTFLVRVTDYFIYVTHVT